MDFYLDERQRRKRRRLLKLKIYGGIFLFFILVVGAAYLVVYSSLFQIKNIEVSDNKYVSSEEIVSQFKKTAVGQSKIANFLTTDNILVWKTDAQSIKNLFPQIENLKIEKDYFNRQVKITVQEREKFGIWCEMEQSATTTQESTISNCFWFDKNGVIFSEAPQAEGNLINKIDDFSGRSLKLGESVLAEKFFSNLFKIFEVLEKSDLGIKSLKLERIELQEILTESSPKIYFSLRIDPSFTLAAIDSMKKIGLEKIEYIDLRVENRAYYKLK
jgi:cell division septal protein FtsQ